MTNHADEFDPAFTRRARAVQRQHGFREPIGEEELRRNEEGIASRPSPVPDGAGEVVTTLHQDRSEKIIIATSYQDVEDIIERNKMLANMPQKRGRTFHHKASIPNVIINQWLNEEHARGNTTIRWGSKEFDELVGKKLRDPNYKFLLASGTGSPYVSGAKLKK